MEVDQQFKRPKNMLVGKLRSATVNYISMNSNCLARIAQEVLIAGCTFLCLFTVSGAEMNPEIKLPRSLPEAEGISSTAVHAFVKALDQVDTMNSVMIVRHGKVIAEGWWNPYGPEDNHILYSLSKSFTSTAVGLAINERLMSLDDTVVSFFPDKLPENPSANLKSMRVRDLLTMNTGQHNEDLGKFSFTSQESQIKQFLALPVAHKPGTHFVYNTPATYMLSAIVQKVTGKTVSDFLQPRLFEPLGISKPVWDSSPEGISLGGYGLSIRTEDIAKFGQLYLQKGMWNGKQLIPASWVAAATSKQTSNGSNPKSDWEQGYGFQFWRCLNGAFRGDGAFGQYCVVMPEQDAVIAITSGVKDMQGVMNLIWQHLLPAMKERTLTEDTFASKELRMTLGQLRVKPPAGAQTMKSSQPFSGVKYGLGNNDLKLESLQYDFGKPGQQDVLRLKIDGKEYELPTSYGEWKKSRISLKTFQDQAAAISGAWLEGNQYLARICLYETPFHLTMKLSFSPGEVVVDSEFNVGFGATKQAQLKGTAEK